MEGIIINYRRGRKTQTTNQMVVSIPKYDTKQQAEKLVGKEAVFTCEGKNKTQIKGEIRNVHGNKGAVRILFERGMPGQAIGKTVVIK